MKRKAVAHGLCIKSDTIYSEKDVKQVIWISVFFFFAFSKIVDKNIHGRNIYLTMAIKLHGGKAKVGRHTPQRDIVS